MLVKDPGEIIPFYWTDITLPELICCRPVSSLKDKENENTFDFRQRRNELINKWSGGFEICTLGMIPLRIRKENSSNDICDYDTSANNVLVIRVFVEIRSGTGSYGRTISFKEENPSGEGSLYRIENHSKFPIWIVQDGVLANPTHSNFFGHDFRQAKVNDNKKSMTTYGHEELLKSSHYSEVNGDLLLAGKHTSFGLDVPFRQGKYVGRKVASLQELLRLRVGLAPLSSRDGIETTKVIGLSFVGITVRLNPSKLHSTLDDNTLSKLLPIRVLGLVYADGPTRVLRFE